MSAADRRGPLKVRYAIGSKVCDRVLVTQCRPVLEGGRFSASSGVSLKSVRHDASRLHVEVDPVAGETDTIEFIGTLKGTDLTGQPILNDAGEPLPTTHRYSSEIGKVLKTVDGSIGSYSFTGNELYVRAKVTSSAEHPNPSEIDEKTCAWIQPVVVEFFERDRLRFCVEQIQQRLLSQRF